MQQTHRTTKLISMLALLLAVSGSANSLAVPPPTIKVYHYVEVNKNAQSPDEEWARVHTTWETTNATEVFILGDEDKVYPPKGDVPFSHEMVLVAVGPGGRTGALAGATPTSKAGPGRWGQIHGFKASFDPVWFFKESSIIHTIPGEKNIPVIEQLFIQAMKRRGFSCGTSSPEDQKGANIIYTLSYEPLASLEQKPEERKREGITQRQAAFTMMAQRVVEEGKPTMTKLAIKPFVRKNMPKDTAEWTEAPADAALPEAQAILDEVIKEVSK